MDLYRITPQDSSPISSWKLGKFVITDRIEFIDNHYLLPGNLFYINDSNDLTTVFTVLRGNCENQNTGFDTNVGHQYQIRFTLPLMGIMGYWNM